MRRVGEAWDKGQLKISHEHIISSQLRSLLGTLMRHTQPAAGAPRIVVTTPPDHLHEFGAILGALMATSRDFEPIYLGANTRFEDIADAATQSGSEVILLSIARHCRPSEQETLLAGLEALSRNHEVWVGIRDGRELITSKATARVLQDYDELDQALPGYKSS